MITTYQLPEDEIKALRQEHIKLSREVRSDTCSPNRQAEITHLLAYIAVRLQNLRSQ